jgi:hypothetical protein
MFNNPLYAGAMLSHIYINPNYAIGAFWRTIALVSKSLFFKLFHLKNIRFNQSIARMRNFGLIIPNTHLKEKEQPFRAAL